MALSRWLGRFAVGASNDSFSIGANAFTLTAGDYYLAGHTGEATSQLCELITAAIVGTYADAAVTYSATTGLVTFKIANSSTYTITWTDTALQSLLGFTGTQSGAATYTAANEPQCVWSPNRGISDAPVDPARLVQPISSTIVHCSRDGTLTSVLGNTRYAGTVSYGLIDGARVFIPSTGSVNKEFETFFEDVIARGERIRVLVNRATYAATTDYVECVVGTPGEPIGAFSDFARRHIASYQGLADLQIPVMKYVA